MELTLHRKFSSSAFLLIIISVVVLKAEFLHVGDICDPADPNDICPEGTECRNGACNCNDLPEGIVMSISVDNNGNSFCRRLVSEYCDHDEQCFVDVKCIDGRCQCESKNFGEIECPSKKEDLVLFDY